MSKLAILGGNAVGTINPPKWPIFDQLEIDLAVDVVKSGSWGTNGPRQVEFDQKWAEYCDCPHAVMMTNGTHTIRLALEALGIGAGDEVIVPGLTWQATASSVLDVNAVPVLVDIDPETYTIDPAAIEAAITPRTRCIIPVHLYARVCNMDAIMAIAKKYNLYVIEDCAHQQGSEWRGQKVGTIGNIGSFSLQASKIFATGEGGLCTTRDKDLYDRMYSLKFCGRETYPGSPTMQSGNFRGNEFAAAMGIGQLTRLTAQNEQRHVNALYLEQELTKLDGAFEALRRDEQVTFQTYYQFMIKYHKEAWRNIPRSIVMKAVKAELDGKLVQTVPYVPLNNSPLYRPFSKQTHKLNAEYCKAIDPARFDLPQCWLAYSEQAYGMTHPMLLGSHEDMVKIVEAFGKVRDNLDELEAFAKEQ